MTLDIDYISPILHTVLTIKNFTCEKLYEKESTVRVFMNLHFTGDLKQYIWSRSTKDLASIWLTENR